MNYYIFTVDHFLKDFYMIDSSKSISINLDNSVTDLSTLNTNDLIYCYSLTNSYGINMLLKVEGKSSSSVTFEKIFETNNKVDVINLLSSKQKKEIHIEYNLLEIDVDTYNNILSSMMKSLKTTIKTFHEKYYENLESVKLDYTIQEIYFGAPGTGKSRETNNIIKKSYPDLTDKLRNDFIFRTTVYSDYSYYDFIGNIMPISQNNNINYEFNPGPFSLSLKQALKYPGFDIFLIIEEMTRGDIAAIFGDIFQLLDRDSKGRSEYEIDNSLIAEYLNDNNVGDLSNKIYLPSNLHIIGTVNTSDQNVNTIDTAFKRRFDFKYVSVHPLDKNGNSLSTLENDSVLLNSFKFTLENPDYDFEWNKFYMTLNKFIVDKLALSEDKQLGQFFLNFLNEKQSEDDKFESLNNKLLHYLWDDVQNITFTGFTIFDEKYVAFSSVYNDFNKRQNVFSKEFLELYHAFSL